MSFPSVVNSNTASTTGVTLTLAMPPSIVAGNLLIAYIGAATNSSGPTLSGGWTQLDYRGSNSTVWVYGKVATGSDSGSINSGGGGNASAAIVLQIQNWDGTVSDCLSASAGASTIDPPSLTMPQAADYLWIAGAMSLSSITGAPSGFSGYTTVASGSFNMATAWLQANATTENPGAFSGSANNGMATTIGVTPVLGTSAPASDAAITGTANNPSTALTVGAGAGAATGTANNPAAGLGGASGSGAATATGNQPEAGVGALVRTYVRLP